MSGASIARNLRGGFGEGLSDLSSRTKGGLASALIRLPTLQLPSYGMGTGTGGEVAEVTAGCSRGGMAEA